MMLPAALEPKEITRQALSEYFLYSIEGTESITDRWAKDFPVSMFPKFQLKTFINLKRSVLDTLQQISNF
jgi:hypothetical protein